MLKNESTSQFYSLKQFSTELILNQDDFESILIPKYYLDSHQKTNVEGVRIQYLQTLKQKVM